MAMKLLGVVLACTFMLGLSPAPTAGATAAKGTVTTIIHGGWISQPGLIPTGPGGDLMHCGVTEHAFATVHGAFDGLWHEGPMTTWCDPSRLPNSLPGKVSGTGTLDVIDATDHSRGSFTWKGSWIADAVTGDLKGVFDATSSSGDPTFGCSSLHLTFDGYFAPTTAPFGGYTGTWTHVCPK